MNDPDYRAEWERTEIARAFAVEVLRFRHDHGLTQQQLAREVGVGDGVIRRLESGEGGPAPAIVELPPLSYEEALAEFLETTGGETPQEFYARFAAGEIEDTGENMALLVKAVALGAGKE